ncbi:dethiobiotin synthase [Treponema primitia ZAS-2]|uniref:ATP-dependent dethiobiotin synthetase BioD n=1 Tax=Treponema primitia (strain ATCC BAA-887 / DSM 12427 / ZAS-2) TaxID=545694 RepID=F5YMQ4_TREPZ|nr:dethiobiotin synthase [Treponema primitia]AEF86791.1 dethiobiotin synthase [Treponema primitia ZAS-2]
MTSNTKKTKGIFISATGTDTGKTFVSALLLKGILQRGLDAGYYKAALSGAEKEQGRLIPGDAEYVRRIAGLKTPAEETVSYVYEHPYSPHLAAQIEGNPAELEKIRADYTAQAARHDYMVAEGSGGIVCPIRMDGEKQIMLTDIIKALSLDILIVVPPALGGINGAVLTASYAEHLSLRVRGFIINRFLPGNTLHEDNKITIEKLTGLPVLVCIEENAETITISDSLLGALF